MQLERSKNRPMLFESCSGQIVYKDSTTEPIFACRELANQCEVRTPSGQYIYVAYVIQDKSGYKMGHYYFAKFNFERSEYFVIDTIKEFQLKENNNEI